MSLLAKLSLFVLKAINFTLFDTLLRVRIKEIKVQKKILKKIQPTFHLQILKRDLQMLTNMAEQR